MANPATQINVVATLVANPAGGFSCVVRWMLGTDNDLPRDGDQYQVVLQPVRIDTTTQPPTVTPQGQLIARATVQPKRLFMVDPPRAAQPVDGYSDPQGRQWQVAQQPSAPVDPSDVNLNDRLGRPMGVCHLLVRTDPGSIAAHTASALSSAMTRQLASASLSPAAAAAHATVMQNRRAAVDLACAIVRYRFKATDLKRHAAASYSRLVASLNIAPAIAGAAWDISPLLRSSQAGTVEQFAHASLAVSTLQDDATIAAIETTSDQPQEVRNHLRLRTLHGGKLIDFWCEPASGAAPCADTDRGKASPAAEALGTGCAIDLTAQQIDQLIVARLGLRAEVTLMPRTAPDVPRLQNGDPGHLAVPGVSTSYDPGQSPPITYASLARAKGPDQSSLPPPAPASSRIDYGMAQSNAAASAGDQSHAPVHLSGQQGALPTFKTGGGKLQILIDPAPPPTGGDGFAPPGAQSTFAFNVYGMWESPQTQAWFDDPTKQPASAAELRPWLMTRRYSYARDLKGAFPDALGAPHPAIAQALSDPPWDPILRSPTTIVDRLSPKATEQPGVAPSTADFSPLPNPTDAGQASFGFDLRRGMGGDAVGTLTHWDPFAPAKLTWSPRQERSGNPVTIPRPQRYRFWVTAVDAFEQESKPVPVQTHDADLGAGNETLFSPVWRAPLLPPPGPQTGSRFGLSYVGTNLQLEFESPFVNDTAGSAQQVGGVADAPRVDAQDLRAKVVVFRRPITRLLANSDLTAAIHAVAAADAPELPQWQRLRETLAAQGWSVFTTIVVAPPPNGQLWRCGVTLGARDADYEYLAGVGFQVADNAAQFWAPNVIGTRTVTLFDRDATTGMYTPRSAFMTETPQASEPVTTGVVPVPNANAARAPQLIAPTAPVLHAAQVLPPPGVMRDHLLLRILSRPFDRQLTTPWRDTGATLTVGQTAMCDTALLRTQLPTSVTPDSSDLWAARRILARGFGGGPIVPLEQAAPPASSSLQAGDPQALLQHPTLGFRGLRVLQWQYANPSTDAEAQEATGVLFRVYGARAPNDLDLVARFATVSGTGQRIGTPAAGQNVAFRFTIVAGSTEAWNTVADLGDENGTGRGRPALVSVYDSTDGNSDPIFVNLISATDSGGQKTITVRTAQTLPASATLYLFAAQSLIDVPRDVTVTTYRQLLPIGGGQDECFAWWLTAVSALGKESVRAKLTPLIHCFDGTLEPTPPTSVYVVPPSQDDDFLDPGDGKQKPFLPSGLTLDDAENLPRLVVAWAPTEASVELTIERDEQRVAPMGMTSTATFDVAISPWFAIQGLEAAPDDKPLPANLLDAVRNNWLMGAAVEAPGNPSIAAPLIGPKMALLGKTGVKQLRVPELATSSDTGIRPAFVDYHGAMQSQTPGGVMDSNWQFRYRLRAFRDLGPDLPEAWRYLMSMPTGWSAWQLPETPPLRLVAGTSSWPESADLMRPTVTFQFTPAPSGAAAVAASTDDDRRWEYRVVVRRVLDVPMPSATGAPADPVWIDVGTPLRFAPGARVTLTDTEVDRSHPDDKPTLTYSIAIQQFMITGNDANQTETLVRGFDRRANSEATKVISIVLQRSSNPDLTETNATTIIYYS
jgi:hypothetical protein